MDRSSNPALRDGIFYDSPYCNAYRPMTTWGTIYKTLFLLPAVSAGFIVAIVTIFKPG